MMDGQKIILVIDDIEMNRNILRISFQEECKVIEAENGLEGLAILEKTEVDLIITDIMMDEMDGYELIKWVRASAKYENVPIVAITEHDEVVQQRVLALGADEFICKPFVARSLRSCVEGILFGDRIKSKIDQFHLVFDQNPIPFVLYHLHVDHQGEYTDYSVAYANKAVQKLLDISEQQLENQRVSPVVQEKLAMLIKANESDQQVREIHYDRHCEKYLDITAYRESEGYIAFVMIDVTMQERARQAIASELSFLENARGNSLLGKCRANVSKDRVDNYSGETSLLITAENPVYSVAVHNIENLCATREMGQKIHEVMMPQQLIKAYADGKRELKIDYMRKMSDGTFLWVSTVVKIYEDPENQEVMCFMYTYDVDQEKTMQMIVDHVMESEFDMMGLLHVQNSLLHCVRASEMEQQIHIGADVEYSTGMKAYVENFIAEDQKEEAREKLSLDCIQMELQKRAVYSVTYPVHFRGQSYQKKWEFSYLGDSQEVIIFTRSDLSDLFEEQERQRETLRYALLRAEQASNAKTDFLSHMSHEIRTPMNAIIGMSTLAAQCVNDPVQVAECISKVGISARFLLSLINDILDMSRIESGKVILKNEQFIFDELVGKVNAIIHNQAREKGVDYECVITSFLDTTYIGDELKLQQIFVNLLGNAIKFTPAGGRTQFIIHQNKVENGRAYMTFTVNDTGIGISEEFQKKMFEPFEQENHGTTALYQGTGLGLAICKNLVDMMGGTITVNSIEGVGTEISINIILDISPDEQEYRLPEDLHLEKMQALVVDDDVLICENTQHILQEMGMRTEWVSSGKQAVALIEERKQKNHYFDIVLLDWRMPDMDGIETARHIREIVGPDITIIVITAYDWVSIEQEARAAGVNLLINKPLFRSTLTSAFHRIFVDKARKEENVQPQDYDFTDRHILMVEDHILNVEVARRLLQSKHAQVDVAENGLRAIELFTKSAENYYDAILMDIRMPVMDGLTSARAIRHLQNKDSLTVPIIAMSANAFEEDVEKSRAAGMNAHLAKPIEPNLLYMTLDRFFLQKRCNGAVVENEK
ncbi:MAG: response regulator [Lachnospiraceae bacterium]|nr:response regulator [Lachnospiraceae bacterium]